jgi:predicted GNAT superfamily acetyltransferase
VSDEARAACFSVPDEAGIGTCRDYDGMTSTLDAIGLPVSAVAKRALAAAGVTVQRLDTLERVRAAEALFCEVWRSPHNCPPLAAEVMRAVEHAGGYVMGAYDGERLLGASSGFLAVGAEGRLQLHSHISGVLPQAQGRRVGWMLKLHQRAWALERGIETITWTFDPLVRRNAWFNLRKLGAQGVEYLVDFYGPMHDGLNAGEPTDRLFARWDLLSPVVVAASEGSRVARVPAAGVLVLDERDGWPWPVAPPPTSSPALVRLPGDVERLRRASPPAARAWRMAVRDALDPLLCAGRRVTGMTDDGCMVIAP